MNFKIKPFLKKNIKNISGIIKQFTKGKKIIQSLIFKMFECLIDKKNTQKRRRIENLVYKALKYFPKFFCIKLLRYYSRKELKKDYEEWLSKSHSHRSKKRLKARIDGTKTGKKYAKKMPLLKMLYDYVNRCYINTHVIYLMVVSIGNKDYIVDFRLVKKDNDSWNKIAKKMINILLRFLGKRKTTLNYLRLSLDGAWGNGDMLLYLSNKGFKYVSIKSGGKDIVNYDGQTFNLKGLESYLSKEGSFKEFNPCHNLDGSYCSAIVHLDSKDIAIRVVLRRFVSSSKGYRYLMLLSSNTDVQNVKDYQIAQCYKDRWGIEECIKECKQVVDLTEYSFHSSNANNIEMFLSLRFCLYMTLNWYRVEHCRPSKTSLYDVADRFRDFFQEIGYKEMWKLFSG